MPLETVGETEFTMSRDGILLHVYALVVTDLDSDFLAGMPFLSYNDVGVLPAKSEITIQEEQIVQYQSYSKLCPYPKITGAQSYVLRAPPRSTVVWPGDFLKVEVAGSLKDEVTVDPRLEAKDAHDWPAPDMLEVTGGRIRLINTSSEPHLLHREEHLCQVSPTRTVDMDQVDLPLAAVVKCCAQLTTKAHHSAGVSVDPDNMLDNMIPPL